MSTLIEDYGIIGDTRTVAAAARNGSIDWWCVPRIDSGAVFAALVGEPQHGRWWVAPKGDVTTIRRSYAGDSLVLETEFETGEGTVKLTDFVAAGLPRHPGDVIMTTDRYDVIIIGSGAGGGAVSAWRPS
jgi:GH15 family glucan-1,4-alpha-glucosidase